MKKYRVGLHAHARMVVEVEAEGIREAWRLACEKASLSKKFGIKDWTPVATSEIEEKQ